MSDIAKAVELARYTLTRYSRVEPGANEVTVEDKPSTRLARAILAMAPVVEAAQAWRRSSCDRLAGCEAGAHDPDCSDWKAEYAITCAVDRLGGVP